LIAYFPSETLDIIQGVLIWLPVLFAVSVTTGGCSMGSVGGVEIGKGMRMRRNRRAFLAFTGDLFSIYFLENV
jgi:hypothetical protein